MPPQESQFFPQIAPIISSTFLTFLPDNLVGFNIINSQKKLLKLHLYNKGLYSEFCAP